MPQIKYLLNSNKSYSYQNNILVDTAITLSVSFTADVPDPDAAGLVPYYRSIEANEDLFFKNLLSNGFEFAQATLQPPLGEDRDNNFSSWTETYRKIKHKREFYDFSSTVNVPVWRLRFVDLVDFENFGESRRLRQAYGFTPLSGNISGTLKNHPGHWSNAFEDYDENKLIVDSASVQERWDNEELVYDINLSWRTYDLRFLPQIRGDWT